MAKCPQWWNANEVAQYNTADLLLPPDQRKLLTLKIVGTKSFQKGQLGKYNVIVTNKSATTKHNIALERVIPKGVGYLRKSSGMIVRKNIPVLKSQQSKNISFTLFGLAPGQFNITTKISLSGQQIASSALAFEVTEILAEALICIIDNPFNKEIERTIKAAISRNKSYKGLLTAIVNKNYEAQVAKLALQHKEMSKDKNVIIIALTASILGEERNAVFAAGCDDFLRKPFKAAEIFDLMHKHIGVRYIYEEKKQVDLQPNKILNPDDLATQAPELLAKLKQGAEEADINLILATIKEIRGFDKESANFLTHLVNNFQYNKILSLIAPDNQ